MNYLNNIDDLNAPGIHGKTPSGCCEPYVSGRCDKFSGRCGMISDRCKICVFRCKMRAMPACRCENVIFCLNKEPITTEQAFRPL